MLSYTVTAERRDEHSGLARCKTAVLALDTDPAGRDDAFNPAELLLASLAACLLKSIERAVPLLQFKLRGAAVTLEGDRQDSPPQMLSITYDIVIESDESDHRLELLHRNVRKFGTISNTLAAALRLDGQLRRAS